MPSSQSPAFRTQNLGARLHLVVSSAKHPGVKRLSVFPRRAGPIYNVGRWSPLDAITHLCKASCKRSTVPPTREQHSRQGPHLVPGVDGVATRAGRGAVLSSPALNAPATISKCFRPPLGVMLSPFSLRTTSWGEFALEEIASWCNLIRAKGAYGGLPGPKKTLVYHRTGYPQILARRPFSCHRSAALPLVSV